MQKTFDRSIDSIADVYEFTENVLESGDIGDALRFPVHLAMEELFVNMVNYYPDNDNEIQLDVEAKNGVVTVTMTDFDVDPFDVTKSSNVDIDAPLDERTPGGLGLHLIQSMVDNLQYDWEDRRSTIRFTKGEGSEHV
jgi:anti-sigma regulatory factor (Ser/Thr protein kinase)